MTRSMTMVVVSLLALAVAFGSVSADDTNAGNAAAMNDSSTVLLQDDFSDSPVDGIPFGWREVKHQNGLVRVVDDVTSASGRALELLSDAVQGKVSQVRLEKRLAPEAEAATVIAIDFKLKWNSGIFNGYIRDVAREEYIVDWAWGLEDDQFRLRNKDVAPLNEGEWTSIRIVADRSTSKAVIYVDDMDEPVGTDISFRNATESWADMVFRLATSPKDEVHQSFFSDVAVWVVE